MSRQKKAKMSIVRLFLSALPKNQYQFETRREWLEYAHRTAHNAPDLPTRTRGVIKRALLEALIELNKTALMCV